METQVRTPNAIFSQPQRFLVPLFQRPYVWNEEHQWEPLWKDLERVATRLLKDPNGKHAPHFLGAVVLQQVASRTGELAERMIIDGQQRLTTLQILLDALDAELRQVGAMLQAERLQYLIENASAFRKQPEDRFKVWPTNRDRPAFNEVMAAEAPVNYSALHFKEARLVKAHQFFSLQSRAWLTCEGENERKMRADAIERSVRELLQVVVIDLSVEENAQEIFETLNARGAQLTAADLIKNFVFQKLLESGAEVEKAYETFWKEFETAFWETEVQAGRLIHQRSSLFINHWLISRTGEEIVAREVFSRFKSFAEHDAGVPMMELLRQLSKAAQIYRTTTESAENFTGKLDRVGLFSYRIKAMDSDVMKSVLLTLLDAERQAIPAAVIDSTLSMIESWLVRRMLVRASTKSYNQFAAELVKVIREADATRVDSSVRSFLVSQTSENRYWPDDEEVLNDVMAMPVYRRVSRGRMRMVLEAIEDFGRGYHPGKKEFAGMRVPRAGYHIEHIMPRRWELHWPRPSAVTPQDRNHSIHTLGNLTLLSARLNSSVSNGAWSGKDGKRAAMSKHDVLLLNSDLSEYAPKGWNDAAIIRRTEAMAEKLLHIWPVPQGYKASTARDNKAQHRAIEISDLLSAGLLSVGQKVYPIQQDLRDRVGTILSDGRIDVEGVVFDSPSGAGYSLRKRATNGWSFWLLDTVTKKSLASVRREYLETSSLSIESADDDTEEGSDE